MPPDHPLRAIRLLVNAALERLSGDYDQFYASGGRDPITAEKLQRALLLQAFHLVRSERRLMEQAIRNMLFRWSIGLSMDAPVRDMAVSTENRDRPRRGGVAGKSFVAVLWPARMWSRRCRRSVSRWTARRSRPGPRWRVSSRRTAWARRRVGGRHGFHRGKRRNETHASTNGSGCAVGRKPNGRASKLCHAGHAVMEPPRPSGGEHGVGHRHRRAQRRRGDGGEGAAVSGDSPPKNSPTGPPAPTHPPRRPEKPKPVAANFRSLPRPAPEACASPLPYARP